jgi:hypothetical protein
MKTKFAGILGFTLLVNAAFAETISVPGKANPWLAGMTNGSTARRGDAAPDESPVPVVETSIEAGAVYAFSVSGSANHGAPNPFVSADGEALISHYLGAENGIADITAPFVSLIGVFLGPGQPDQKPAPPSLDFRNPADRDFLALAPALRQPFFIGDGLTSSNDVQQVIAPPGATRLFLGVMDEYGWYDNEGSFTVQVARAPSNSIVLLSLHPSLHPTTADAVANTAAAIAKAAVALNAVSVTPPDVTPATSPNVSPATTIPGPELHAYTAIEISWPSENNRSYQVQWAPSLDSPQWANLGPIFSGSGGEISLFDSTRAHPQGFYRVQIVP